MKLTYLRTDDMAIFGRSPLMYIHSIRTIVLGDLHLGQHEAILKSGSEFISNNVTDIVGNIRAIAGELEITRIILNGDIKHNTKHISGQERRELELLFSLEIFKTSEVVLVVGNHDPFLKMGFANLLQPHWIASKQFEVNGYLFTHGDIFPEISENIHTIILSHEHPSISLKDASGHSIRAKCFVELRLKNSKIHCVILPASGRYTIGVKFPVKNKSRFLSEFLQQNAVISSQVIYAFTNELGPYRLENETL